MVQHNTDEVIFRFEHNQTIVDIYPQVITVSNTFEANPVLDNKLVLFEHTTFNDYLHITVSNSWAEYLLVSRSSLNSMWKLVDYDYYS